ncbi:MAG: efflux RND transporter permease subunit, partial [Pseudomonadota bacterium]
MSPSRQSTEPGRGGRDLIGLFVRHRTAANLLMAIMIIAGIFGLVRMNTQFFPDFGIDVVSVAVVWPGASADDVDTNIVQAIEPEVRFLDGVKRVRSSSVEGRAAIAVEFVPGTDMQAALSNVETAVGQVTTLPEDSETPIIQRIVRYETISRLSISGPYKEQALKAIAKRIRDDLLKRGIDKVTIFGARDDEIWVEIQPGTLRRLGLTLDDVATKIRQTSQDVPSGDVSGRSERQIRSLGLLKSAHEIGGVEVRSLENGQKIYLRDIARVTEQFEEGGKLAVRNGQKALELHIQRATAGDALVLDRIVTKYLKELRPTLPPKLKVEQYDVAANLIRSRINLLLKNGSGGLVLVVLILFVFLNSRVAFFVALGIPISLLATMMVMLLSGQTINMVSLFGLIMTLGIIVDDAIVVGEHSEHLYRTGADAVSAADRGAHRMAAPVFSSSLTTIGAFLPLLLISDIIGQIIKAIPLVVIAVIVASLVECFLVLPGHMREALAWKQRAASRARRAFDAWFERMRDGWFTRVVQRCIAWRYATLATALAAFIVSIGVVQGGRIGFVFFPNPEVDNLFGNVQFVAGTPREKTVKMIAELDRAMRAAEKELTGGKGKLVHISFGKLGSAVGLSAGRTAFEGDNVGGLFVQLIPTDQRDVSSKKFIETWRKHVRGMAGLEKLTVKAARGGPPGRDVDVRLSGSDPETLKKAANEVRALLSSIPGVLEIEDDLPYGKRETILELSPKGKALGFTTESVGRQVRNAFEGAIAKRFARGDEEVIVRVQYPRRSIGAEALNSLYLRGPKGNYVPLTSVVNVREKIGFARIR